MQCNKSCKGLLRNNEKMRVQDTVLFLENSMTNLFPRRKKGVRPVVRFDRLKDNEHSDDFRKKVTGRLVGAKAGGVEGVGRRVKEILVASVDMCIKCVCGKEIE